MSEPKRVITDGAPPPIGPYSQAVRTGSLLFTSGQIPMDPGSGEIVAGGIVEQTRQVLANLDAVLQAGGATAQGVVKVTVFLQDMSDFPAMNELYAGYFPGDTPPARSTVEVARLPKDVLVEIEAVAVT